MGCNLPCDPECKKTLGNQGRPCMPAWGALGRRPWPPPWPGGARPGCREGRDFGGCSPSARERMFHRVKRFPKSFVTSDRVIEEAYKAVTGERAH